MDSYLDRKSGEKNTSEQEKVITPVSCNLSVCFIYTSIYYKYIINVLQISFFQIVAIIYFNTNDTKHKRNA